jgi:hypothetical protein
VTRQPDDNDRYALYANAHHDLWWAKTQQWSVANWALLLIAGVAGVGRTLTPSCQPTLESPTYVGLVVVVALWAGEYFRRLHDEIVHNRGVYRELEKQTGIKQLRTGLRGQERGEDKTDWRRGIGHLSVMVIAITVASVLAIRLLGTALRMTIQLGIGILVVDLVLVIGGARVSKWRRDRPARRGA